MISMLNDGLSHAGPLLLLPRRWSCTRIGVYSHIVPPTHHPFSLTRALFLLSSLLLSLPFFFLSPSRYFTLLLKARRGKGRKIWLSLLRLGGGELQADEKGYDGVYYH